MKILGDNPDKRQWANYNVKPEDVTSDQRFIGKQSILGLQYQLGPKRFVEQIYSYGRIISKEFATDVIKTYRETCTAVRDSWKEIEYAAVDAIDHPKRFESIGNNKAAFSFEHGCLWMHLPSGRRLCYMNAFYKTTTKLGIRGTKDGEEFMTIMNYSREHENKAIGKGWHTWTFDSNDIYYEGYDPKRKGWFTNCSTYGGHLVENLTQATCRDLLCDALVKLENNGYPVIMHIHDEAACMVPDTDDYNLKTMIQIMEDKPKWAKGFAVKAAGYESKFYKKD